MSCGSGRGGRVRGWGGHMRHDDGPDLRVELGHFRVLTLIMFDGLNKTHNA